jgi:hypothetical protein
MSEFKARHCMNQWCEGPEWWSLVSDSGKEYAECPRCGYPCSLEVMTWPLTTDEVMHDALLSEREGGFTMKFSMNGFRRQLSGDVGDLRFLIQKIVNGDHVDHEDLIDSINAVITHSNVINCVYSNDDPDFSDMSHLEIDHIEREGGGV